MMRHQLQVILHHPPQQVLSSKLIRLFIDLNMKVLQVPYRYRFIRTKNVIAGTKTVVVE